MDDSDSDDSDDSESGDSLAMAISEAEISKGEVCQLNYMTELAILN